MANWILKTEPDSYSFQQLTKDGRARWDGVTNPVALGHLRKMQPGDELMIYHTGAEKQCIGLAKVTGAPYLDPNDSEGRLVVVDIAPVKALPRCVTLAEIKAQPELAELALVRMPRLSVVPATPAQWNKIIAMANSKAG